MQFSSGQASIQIYWQVINSGEKKHKHESNIKQPN